MNRRTTPSTSIGTCAATLAGALLCWPGVSMAGIVDEGKRDGLSPTPHPLLTQMANPGTAVQAFDFILNECLETEHTTDPKSALRSVDPAGLLRAYLENRDDTVLDVLAFKTSLLERPKHGQIVSGVSNLGRTSYRYDPDPGYLGNDRAVFLAEFQRKRYKIVVELKVFRVVDEKAPQCPPPRLIKVKG